MFRFTALECSLLLFILCDVTGIAAAGDTVTHEDAKAAIEYVQDNVTLELLQNLKSESDKKRYLSIRNLKKNAEVYTELTARQEWKSSSGKYAIVAKYIGGDFDKLTLEKDNGKTVTYLKRPLFQFMGLP